MSKESEQPKVFLSKTLEEWEEEGARTEGGERLVSGPDRTWEKWFEKQPLDQLRELDKELAMKMLDIKADAERRVNHLGRIRRAIRDSGVTPYDRGNR